MKYLVFDDMGCCTDADVKRLQGVVSKQRLDKAMRYKFLFGQWACLKTYEMLLNLLNAAEIPDWEENEWGKPFIKGGPYFSISHCKNALMVGVSEKPIGVDVERVRNADIALVERTMNREERDCILNAADRALKFTELWTRKEAWLKWKGTGIIDDLENVLLDVDENRIITQSDPEKGYVWSLISE
ncbi:MAG: 4'-phosphopantetheinyl transferase superfamily protein [Paludibacteraceae bacterium]|nr:4'-phosphopantetheinyl transferase superfamily protein [Paludibacteraceae bacterium]